MSATLQGVSARKITRRYGLGYKGYTSSVPAHLCPKDKIWGALNTTATPNTAISYNLLYDPTEEKFFRRAGSTPIGGTTGIVESIAVNQRARKLIELSSPSLQSVANGGAGGDGYPTHCVLFTDETSFFSGGGLSAVYVRSTIGSLNYTLGMEFNATNHYPGTTAATFNIKCIPYMIVGFSGAVGAVGFGRLDTATKRAYVASGSRGMLDVGGQLYLPSFTATPMRWNKRYNESTSSGTENLRLWHVGPIPPLKMPTVATGTANANGVWQSGDLFFNSVVYQFADGSCSAPIIPRDINDTLASGLGRVSVGASCDYLDVSGLPVGPEGVEGRWYCRSPKFNSTGAVGTAPAIKDLRVVDYIPNNTQTTYRDFAGNDLNLKDRPDVIRFDREMQHPARYIGTCDGRVIVGYTRPIPQLIYLCPDVNVSDDDASLLTTVYEYSFAESLANELRLYKGAAHTDLATAGLTCRQVVDLINATVSGGSGGKWWAQMAPGADGDAVFSTANIMSLLAGTGDSAPTHMRCFGTSYPGVIFRAVSSDLAAGATADKLTQKARWFFTQGGADVPSMLADSYLTGNSRTGMSAWGILMGFAPMPEGCLIFFSKAIIHFTNRTTGKSGLDEDYHPYELFTDIGCIAWDSIAWGNGWAGCLTEQGYFVFDLSGRRKNISKDVWNATTQSGEWAYEVAQCSAAVGADTDGAHFHAKVMGSAIYWTWRSDSGVTIPNRMIRYDFSPSAGLEGIQQVLNQDGEPWGCSSGLGLSLSVLGEVRKSTGVARYGAVESVSTGRVDQFETGTTDNAAAIAAALWGPIDFAESLDKKAAQEARVIHKGNSSGIKFHFRRTDGVTTSLETGSGLALPTTGASGTFAKTVVPLPQNARSQAIGNQIEITDDGSGGAMEVWGGELDQVVGSSYS